MSSIGTLTIEMAANVARLQQDMQAVKGTVSDAMSTIKRYAEEAGTVLSALGVTASLTGLYEMAKAAINSAAELQQLSERTNVSVESLSALRSAAKLSGTDDRKSTRLNS